MTFKQPPNTRSLKRNEIPDNLLFPKLQAWRDDILLFCKEVLHIVPDEQQSELLKNFYSKKKVACKSGRGCGKTYVAGMIVWHFLCTRYSQVMITAPGGGTIGTSIWPTLAKLHSNMEPVFRDQFDILQTKIVHKEHPLEWFCMARTARREQPEALAGAHAKHLLFVIDEASGVEDAVFTTSIGSLTEEQNYLLMISNPRRLSGYFYEAFRPINKEIFLQMTFSALKSKFVTRSSIEQWKTMFGEGSNTYRVEVLGEFPEKDDDSIIPIDILEESVIRIISQIEEAPIMWGVDMGMGSDKSILVKRQGNYVYDDVKKWRDRDTMITVGRIKQHYDETPDELKPSKIYVDSIGVGKGPYDRMKELGLPVFSSIASGKPVNRKYIFNAKAEWWSEMRRWFLHDKPKIPNDRMLIEQLSTVRSVPDSSGKFKIESKDRYKTRNPSIGSPDEADALAMTFSMKSKKVVGITYID